MPSETQEADSFETVALLQKPPASVEYSQPVDWIASFSASLTITPISMAKPGPSMSRAVTAPTEGASLLSM